MAVQEGLGGLRRVGLDEASVAVGQVPDKVVGLLLYSAELRPEPRRSRTGRGPARGRAARTFPCVRPPMLPHVVLDRGVSPTEPVLVPEPLKDALGRVALLSGDPVIIIQDAVDDAGVGLSLGAGEKSAPVARAAPSRPASCAPCTGANRTPGRLPECSSPPPSPRVGPARYSPPGTSIPPSISSTSNLWMAADGAFFNRPKSVSRSARVVHFNSAAYN